MKKAIVASITSLVCLLGVTPVALGMVGLGDKRGPWFYPESIHETLFAAGCVFGGRPIPKDSIMQPLYRRAPFFGMNHIPLSPAERERKIAAIVDRGAPRQYVEMLQAEHERLKTFVAERRR